MTAPKEDNPIAISVAPVLEAAGFRRKGSTWLREVGEITQRVRVSREMKYPDAWSIMLHVDIKEAAASGREIVHEALIDQIYNIEGVDRTSWGRIRDALNLRSPMLVSERASILIDAVRNYALPTLDRVGSRQGLVACYLGEALRDEVPPFGRLDWRVAKLVGLRWMNTSADVVDVAVVGKPKSRLTAKDLRGKKGALLHLWNSASRACVKEHRLLMRIVAEGVTKGLFGIHTDSDAERAAAFLRQHGNPYKVSGYDDKNIWYLERVPQTFALDAKGRVTKCFGTLKESDIILQTN